MNIVNEMIEIFDDFSTNIKGSEYTYLIILSLLAYVVMTVIKKMLERYYLSLDVKTKKIYEHNYKSKIILNVALFVILFIIWEGHFSSIITVISFISAGATIALREIIFNFFAGIYIHTKKPFVVGDRIELNSIKGDVVSINSLNFEVLEIGNRINGEQSSGIIVGFPNSLVLTMPVKNYVKEFKYIWNEITLKIPLESDVINIRKELYKIIKNNEILKNVPKKMENEIGGISLNYHIYFNNLEPVIYTKIVDDHVELYARYLVNPKKARLVEDALWDQIIIAYQNKKIDLFIKGS